MTRLINASKKATTELEQLYKKDPCITDKRVWPVLEHLRFLERLFSQFDKHIHTKWFKLDNLFDLQKTVNAVRDCEEAIKALVEAAQGCKDITSPRCFGYSPQPDRPRPYCLKRQTLGRLEDAAEEISAKITEVLGSELRVENFKGLEKESQTMERSRPTEISKNKPEEDGARQRSIPPPPPLPKLPCFGQPTMNCISKQKQKNARDYLDAADEVVRLKEVRQLPCRLAHETAKGFDGKTTEETVLR